MGLGQGRQVEAAQVLGRQAQRVAECAGGQRAAKGQYAFAFGFHRTGQRQHDIAQRAQFGIGLPGQADYLAAAWRGRRAQSC